MCNQELELASMQNSWGQGTAQTSSHSTQPTPARASGDVSFTSLACASFDTLLSAPLPSSSNIGDHRRSSAKAPHPNEVLKCPRCESLDTKFCYYNNYSLTQPRYFCKNCKRYWTAGGALRNVPVGGGLRKNKRSKLKLAAAAAAAAAADAEAARVAQQGPGSGMQPQSGQSVVDGEASQISENRASPLPASGALPSHVVVGVPEISHLYGHPTGEMCAMNCHAGRNLSSSASQCSVENIVSQNGARAPASMLPAQAVTQAGNFYGKEDANAAVAFFCDPNQIPQFYSSYAAGVSMPFSSATVPSGSVPGYAVNYSFFTADPCRITDKEERCSNTCETAMGRIGSTAVDSSIGEVKQEKDEAQAPVNTYDWQLISEGLFNGTGSSDSNFLYTPSSSWPDFSQFNDAGPG